MKASKVKAAGKGHLHNFKLKGTQNDDGEYFSLMACAKNGCSARRVLKGGSKKGK